MTGEDLDATLAAAQQRMAEDDGASGPDEASGFDARALAQPGCPHCHATGYAKVDDGGVMPRQVPCPCALEAHRRLVCDEQIEALFGKGGARKSFKSYDTGGNAWNAKALETCQRYVKEFPKFRQEGYGFALVGEPGAGKTHLAIATMRAIIKVYGGRPGFVPYSQSVPDLMDLARERIQRSQAGDYTFANVIDRAKTASIYLLDDIGAERHKREQGMSWVDETLFKILNHRIEEGLPTIMTSNLTLTQLEGHVDARVASRLNRKTLSWLTVKPVPRAVEPPSELIDLLEGR